MEESTVLVEAVEKVSGRGLKGVLILVGAALAVGVTVFSVKAIKAHLAKRGAEEGESEA
jgi:hypothetical protein